MAATTLTWKKRANCSTKQTALSVFQESETSSSDDDDEKVLNEVWKSRSKRTKALTPSTNQDSPTVKERCSLTMAKECAQTAITLAESCEFERSLPHFEKSLLLDPNVKIFEMQAQVLNELGHYFEAIKSCEKAIKLEPNWNVTYHTLARCQSNFGEVDLAVASMSKAVHLNPVDMDLWTELRQFSKHKIALSKNVIK